MTAAERLNYAESQVGILVGGDDGDRDGIVGGLGSDAIKFASGDDFLDSLSAEDDFTP